MKSIRIFLMLFVSASISLSAASIDDLTYTVNGDTITITDCNISASGELVIPDTIDGLPVTVIGEKAFSECENLTTVIIASTVTTIGVSAFERCESLSSINIPNSVVGIADSTFERCESLTSITIPDSVTSIGKGAFKNCETLTSITIPDSVTTIGAYAFAYSSLNEVTIPYSVTSIGTYAFYIYPKSSNWLTKAYVYYNENASYDANAFYGCYSPFNSRWTNSINITVYHSVDPGLSFKVFPNSYGQPLEKASFVYWEVPNDGDSPVFTSSKIAPAINENSGANQVVYTAIANDTSTVIYTLKSVDDSSSFTIDASTGEVTLTEYADYEDQPSYSFTIVAIDSFDNSSELAVTLSINNLDEVGDLTLTLNEAGTGYKVTDCQTAASDSLEVPSTYNDIPIIGIGENAFGNCDLINSIIIPENVTEIHFTAFDGCASLQSITFLATTAPTLGDEFADTFTGIADETVALVTIEALNSFGGFGNDWNGLIVSMSASELSVQVAQLTEKITAVTAERDARPTVEQFASVAAERDSRPTSDQLATVIEERNTAIAERDARPIYSLKARIDGQRDVTSDPALYNLVTQANYAAVVVERDARPTAEELAVVKSERDARPTQEAYDAVIAERDARPTTDQLQDARNGSIVINAENGEVAISLKVEESEDLKTWQATGERITKTVQLKNGKKFYRFALDK